MTKVVVNARVFHLITDPAIKLLPLAVNVNVAAPAVVVVGEIELNTGTAFKETLIVKINAEDDPPPGEGLKIVMFAVPEVTTTNEGTVAVNCVLLM